MSWSQVQSSHLLFVCTVLDEAICEPLCHSRRQQNNVTTDKGICEPKKRVNISCKHDATSTIWGYVPEYMKNYAYQEFNHLKRDI